MNDKVLDLARRLNENQILNNVSVPIIDGFKVIPNEGTLFTAVSDEGFVEQFLVDGTLEKGETFDARVEKVINETKDSMKKSSMEDVDNSLFFFKNYSNGNYNFKLYIQDNILNEKIIRQFNIYFVDERTKAFYEICFSSCPYSIDNLDYVKQDLTANMITTVNNMLDYIK